MLRIGHKSKAQGISITTIIIAAVALLVLIVLIAVFSGKMQLWGRDYDTSTTEARNKICWSQPGHCVSSAAECATGEYLSEVGKWLDCGTDQGCCKSS